MTTKKIYRYLFHALLCVALFVSCKSDKAKISADKEESPTTVVTHMKKEYSKKTDSSRVIREVQLPDSAKASIKEKAQSKTTEPASNSIAKNQQENEQKSIISTKKTKPRQKLNKKKPKIQFEELIWDFGEITEGDIVEKKFKFTNTGDAPLEIIATSATCGCTRPTFPFLNIAPGESNVIGVSYNSVGKEGAQMPEVTIESNTEPKTTVLKLKGTVKPKPKKEEKTDTIHSKKDSIVLKQ